MIPTYFVAEDRYAATLSRGFAKRGESLHQGGLNLCVLWFYQASTHTINLVGIATPHRGRSRARTPMLKYPRTTNEQGEGGKRGQFGGECGS